jgi:ParB family chromosome partitioning protein
VEVRTVGRSQRGRPETSLDAVKQADAERALVGALSVPIEQIAPDPEQPRKQSDPDRLDELAASIGAYGVLQPLVVREGGLLDDGRTRYVIVAGGRRYEAATRAGLTRLPVLVRDSAGATLRILQLTENIQREQLDPVDEARAFRELMDLATMDTRVLAERVHRSHTYVADRLKLIAHEDVAEAVMHGVLTPSAAVEVAREPDAGYRQTLIQRASQTGLQKRDIQRLRRARQGMPAVELSPVERKDATLREVAYQMGASEDQIAAAAQARQDEPTLTPAEALALALSTDGRELFVRPFEAVSTKHGAPDGQAKRATEAIDHASLAQVVRRAGGRVAVLTLLDWAAARNLSLSALRASVDELAES